MSLLTAGVFAIGALEHAVQAVAALSAAKFQFSAVQSWCHAQMTAVDATIATVALTHPRFLPFCLLAFLAEQGVAHGPWVWNEWTVHHQIPWVLVIVDGLILLLLVGAIFAKRNHASRRTSLRD